MLMPVRFLPDPPRSALAKISISIVRVESDEGEARLVYDQHGAVVRLPPGAYPALPAVTEQEAKALRLMRGTTWMRDQGFQREGLGRYSPENEVVRSLGAKGFLSVGKIIRHRPLLEIWLLNDSGGLPL